MSNVPQIKTGSDLVSVHDEMLDAILEQASWPEPSTDDTAKLTAFYRRHRLRRTLVGAAISLAAAASIALVAAMAWDIDRRPSSPESAIAESVHEPAPPFQADAPSSKVWQIVVTRTPTQRPTPPDPADEVASRVDNAIEQLVITPLADVTSVTRELLHEASAERYQQIESHLQAAVDVKTGNRLLATLQLLGEVGTWRSLPLIMRAAERPEFRDATMPAIVRLADIATLLTLAEQQPDSFWRRRLFAAVLQRDASQSVPIYLQLIRDNTTVADALAALDLVAHPPVHAFMRYMEHPSMDTRFAAAIIVGRIADRQTLQSIVPLIDQPARRQEALVAMLNSTDPMAGQVIQNASQNPSLAALIQQLQPQIKESSDENVSPYRQS